MNIRFMVPLLIAAVVGCANAAEPDSPTQQQDAAPQADDRFQDHGVAVPIAQCRGVYTVADKQGTPLAIATSMDQSPRGWILVTDVDGGVTEQVLCPEGVPNSPPYESVMGSNGKFYTSQGRIFLEFDPTSRQWTFQAPAQGARAILSMAEGPDGTIWLGDVYTAGLHSFNPKTREFRNHGRMDDQEQYCQYLGFDEKGWVYCGIGTALASLVAYNPETGERRQLVPNDARTTNIGQVWRGADGKLYGSVALKGGSRHYLLSDGRGTPVEAAQLPAKLPARSRTKPVLPDGRIVSTYSFPARYGEIYDPAASNSTRIAFDYDTAGAGIRPHAMTAGPDGKLYVNSGHPAYMACYDPKTDTLTHFPDPHAQQSLAVQGKYVFGGRYTGGMLKLFDTTRPWNTSPVPPAEANPTVAIRSSRPDINRPIVSFAHPDGDHVMIAGMPCYGMTGGGLSIYSLATGKTTKLSNQDLIPRHSITALAALPDGDLMGSTTVAGTHGGHAIETNALLFKLDWETKTVVWKTAPIPGMGAIVLRKRRADGKLYCTGNAPSASGPSPVLFLFDPKDKQVVQREDLAPYGGGGPMIDLPDGRVCVMARDAILRLGPDTCKVEKVAEAPTPIGASALLGDRVYFASGSHVWSFRY